MTNAARNLFIVPLGLLLAHCGAPEVDGPENLGPYAEQMPWDETVMAASTPTTVGGLADSGTCTTAGVRGLSDQIVAQMNCIHGGLMANISGDNVTFSSAAALPYLQTPAANGLKKATAGHSALPLNSTLRTTPQQWMLYYWYQTGRCSIQLAARPGQSNHEGGLALDTSQYSSWKSLLDAHGFKWFGSADVVHFDWAGGGGADAHGVLAFQRLWNHNHPGDKIAEDGDYGPETEARIKKSPRLGFSGAQSCN